MPSIMKKRFTVSSTTVCLTHSLPSTSNRSTSASLTRNPSRWPWRALRRPPVRNRCHKSSHPVPLLLIPKLLQAIRWRLQRIRRWQSSRPHVLARRHRHAVWAFHVHEGAARAAPPGGTAGRGRGRGSSGWGHALGAAGPSVMGLGGQAVPGTAVGVPRGSIAGDRAGAPATAGASGHRRSTPKVNHFSSSSQAATGFPSCQHQCHTIGRTYCEYCFHVDCFKILL
jgi:hypothetical protein